MKIGHVEINVRQYADSRWGFDDYSLGERKKVRLKTKLKADRRATDLAVVLANGRDDLLAIDRVELAAFRQWKSATSSSRGLSGICAEFLALKRTKSSRHVQSLERDLKLFERFIGTAAIASIMAPEIQRFLDSRDAGQRRKLNLRSAIVSLFRWARRMSYLPDRTTEPEKLEPIELVAGQANILTAGEMRTLLDNVQPQFFPWLVIAAFAGVRSEEIAPDPRSKKSALKWEDLDWSHKTIIIRAQTAKTGEEREIPLLPNLAEWLAPWRAAKGSVIGATEQPSKRETTRLGKYIGGGKHNCLRDSFCSYRARITQNVPQVSYEMGNSIPMVKRSYHRRQPIRAAQEWFALRPAKSSKVVAFPKIQSAA